MRILAVIPLIFLLGCGTGFKVKQYRYVAPGLEPYVEHFEEVYNLAIDYPIEFADLEPGIVGRCRLYGGQRNVYIDSTFFEMNQYDTGAIHQLIFHELGHCSLLLNHNDNLNEQNQEVSIMNSYAFGNEYYYLDNLDYYIESLTDSRAVPWNEAVLEWGCKNKK